MRQRFVLGTAQGVALAAILATGTNDVTQGQRRAHPRRLAMLAHGACYRSVRQVQQLQRRGVAGQVGAREVKVDQRGANRTMAQQVLDGVDVGAGLEKVGGEGVPLMPNSA